MLQQCIYTLRSSTDNEARHEASRRLRQLQEETPGEFLNFVLGSISGADRSQEDRFFLGSVLQSFVEESWRSWKDEQVKGQQLEHFTRLALSDEVAASEPLARKLGSAVACMAKNGPKQRTPGALPPYLQFVTDAYASSLERVVAPNGGATMQYGCHVLLLIHLLLKEVQTKRIGKVFEKLCELIAPTVTRALTVLPFSAVQSPTQFLFALRALKCAHRVFGCALFNGEFCNFVLQEAWKLAPLLGTADSTKSFSRLMDYAVKVLHKTMVYFPTQLRELGLGFFVPTDPSAVGTASDTSLLHFVYSVVMTCKRSGGVEALVSEKTACRAMNVVTVSLTAEDAEPFIAEYISRFFSSPLLLNMMEAIITTFLADDCSEETARLWSADPERALEDLDVEFDDEYSSISCAEQLFLAMTGSTLNAERSLAAAWATVHRQLSKESDGDITAALHAIGIGYFTLRQGSGYADFFSSTLLPLLEGVVAEGSVPDSAPRTSIFVLRRVVWLIGMWCESLEELPQRQVVHKVLGELLRTQSSVVLGLTALRAVENFVSDEHFSVEELPSEALASVLSSVESILPLLQSPTVAKALVGLLYVLLEKGALATHGDGDAVIRLLCPAANHFILKYNASAGGDDEDEDAGMDTALLSTLLECLASAFSIASGSPIIWEVYGIVLACTQPETPLSPWVEEEGWELLLSAARWSTAHLPVMEEALRWCLQNTTRDFPALPTVFRTAATLLLLRADPIEDVVGEEHMVNWLEFHKNADAQEAAGAQLSFFLSIMIKSSGLLRGFLSQQSLFYLVNWPTDVQKDPQPLHYALIIAMGLKDSGVSETLSGLLQTAFAAATPNDVGCALPERLLLLADVSSNKAYDTAIQMLLHLALSGGALSGADAAATRVMLEGLQTDGESGETEEERGVNAILDVTANFDLSARAPFYRRVVETFGPLLTA